MNDKNFLNDLEDQIHKTVQDAMDLKDTVVRSVKENTDMQKRARPVPPNPKPYAYPGRPAQPQRVQVRLRVGTGPSVSGIVMEVLGLFGAISTGLAFLILAAAAAVGMPWAAFAISSAVLLPLCAGSSVLTGCGVRRVRRKRRFLRYQALLNGGAFCTLDRLASAVGQSKAFVLRDLRKMIRDGWFPQGHIDEKETCLIVTDETYRQYLQTQEQARQRQLEEARRQQEPKSEDASDLEAVIADGRDYLWQIRMENRAISNEVISQKLQRLEGVSAKIFSHVEAHPQKLPDIRKFMQYYLPTTLKLVKAYHEFDEQPVQGENITKAKAEIGETLDTINTAFETLLDSLFQDDVLDISTDISMLETMLAQEGLTEDEFGKKKS